MNKGKKLAKKYGKVELSIDPSWNTIGLQISGGADSALLAFLLGKSLNDLNLHKISIMRITLSFDNRPPNAKEAAMVQSFVEKKFPSVRWEDPFHRNYPSRKDGLTREILKELFYSGKIDHTMNARTKNPSIKEVADPDGLRVIERDNPVHLPYPEISEPFFNLKKDELLRVYRDLGIWDLFEVTNSCDADLPQKDYKEPCGVCWWCRERQWALGKIEKNKS